MLMSNERHWCNAKRFGDDGERRFIQEVLEPNDIIIHKWMEIVIKNGGSARDESNRAIPDFELINENKSTVLVDVKSKAEPVYYGNAHEYRHGIDGVKYRDYLSISKEQNVPIYIAVVEDIRKDFEGNIYAQRDKSTIDIGDILFVNLKTPYIGQEYVNEKQNAHRKKPYEGMVFWKRNEFMNVNEFIEQIRRV
jgi:hypothetical protein